MLAGAGKSKFAFHRILAPEPISVLELDAVERLLARFVALAYAGDHPDLFSSAADMPELAELPKSSGRASRSDGPAFSCSALP
jgi:hypothetical protein